MRLIIIAADFGTLCFGKKLLEKIDMPVQSIFLYILNPFIIIELTGNLHFEGVMIFFLIWALYLFHLGKWRWSAFIFTCSISVKLIPLIFLPLFVNWFYNGIKSLNNWKQMLSGTKRLIQFYGLIGLITLALFAPFYSSGFIKNYTQTIALWFQDFEFNASLYYIARTIGYSISGYNEINIIGKIIPILVILFVLCMAFFRKNRTTIELITSMLLVLTFYYFTSTTVHPWYIATLLILSIFTRYKFPLVWSFVAILSYLAYANLDNSENLWIIGIEYTCVYSIFIWEVILNKKAMILKS